MHSRPCCRTTHQIRMCRRSQKKDSLQLIRETGTGFFGGDKSAGNRDNRRKSRRMRCVRNRVGKSPVTASRYAVLLIAASAGCIALQPARTLAQWWPHAPTDFEECADTAEKASTKETKAQALAECNSRFAGRRKPGGGYTYYDFMQNRNFDIAGPNPTPEEQRKIDQQYTEFLDQERRNSLAAAAAAKQAQQEQQQQRVQPVTYRPETTERIPLPVEARNKQPQASADVHARARYCAKHTFSCEWPRLSEGIKDFKKMLFRSSSNKAKRGSG